MPGPPPAVVVRPLEAGERDWVRATLVRNWASTTVARRGELIEARDLAGRMDLCASSWHGVRASRRLKPSIPLHDSSGHPIDHELEFQLLLDPELQ